MNEFMGMGLGAFYNQATSAQAHQRQKKLMGIQLDNQRNLNKQGQELAMKTWRETNYPAQMKMLKEAGLNPGLLYGMGS